MASTLFALMLCLQFAACGEEDYSTPTADALVNTTWTGQDSGSMYNQVLIFSKDGLTYVVRSEQGEKISSETMTYTYDETDGSFHAWSDNFEFSGTINSSYMTIHIDGETIILDKE